MWPTGEFRKFGDPGRSWGISEIRIFGFPDFGDDPHGGPYNLDVPRFSTSPLASPAEVSNKKRGPKFGPGLHANWLIPDRPAILRSPPKTSGIQKSGFRDFGGNP